ncbi:MAG: hypothetical protein ABIR96_08410, partial [Bdellovibrionota bacterium]
MNGYYYLPLVFSTVLLGACQRQDASSTGGAKDVNGVTDPAYLLSRQQILDSYSDVSCESLRHL